MKRLWVLVLALALALGMSAIVGAAGVNEQIPVTVSVAKHATMELWPETDALRLHFVEPGRDVPGDNDNKQEHSPVQFTIRTNSAVTLQLEEDFIDGFLSLFDLEQEEIWPWADSDYIISPNIVLTRLWPTEGVDPKVQSGHSIEHALEGPGEYGFELRVEARWNIDQEWWRIQALDDEVPVGFVLVTIAAD